MVDGPLGFDSYNALGLDFLTEANFSGACSDFKTRGVPVGRDQGDGPGVLGVAEFGCLQVTTCNGCDQPPRRCVQYPCR